jgi:hypothetical protein
MSEHSLETRPELREHVREPRQPQCRGSLLLVSDAGASSGSVHSGLGSYLVEAGGAINGSVEAGQERHGCTRAALSAGHRMHLASGAALGSASRSSAGWTPLRLVLKPLLREKGLLPSREDERGLTLSAGKRLIRKVQWNVPPMGYVCCWCPFSLCRGRSGVWRLWYAGDPKLCTTPRSIATSACPGNTSVLDAPA